MNKSPWTHGFLRVAEGGPVRGPSKCGVLLAWVEGWYCLHRSCPQERAIGCAWLVSPSISIHSVSNNSSNYWLRSFKCQARLCYTLGHDFPPDPHSSPVRYPHFVEEAPCASVPGVDFGFCSAYLTSLFAHTLSWSGFLE